MLFEIINDSSRRPNQNVDAILERFTLFLVIDTTVGKAETKTGIPPQQQCILVNLNSQFPGGCEHQSAWIFSGCLRGVLEQSLKNNQQEGCRFSGSSLSLSCNVFPLQSWGQCQRLDRGAVREPGLGQALLH